LKYFSVYLLSLWEDYYEKEFNQTFSFLWTDFCGRIFLPVPVYSDLCFTDSYGIANEQEQTNQTDYAVLGAHHFFDAGQASQGKWD
jgi:hypothetical protein